MCAVVSRVSKLQLIYIYSTILVLLRGLSLDAMNSFVSDHQMSHGVSTEH